MIKQSKGDSLLILAGNKEDLSINEVVPPEEAATFAKNIGAIYKKVSAKDNIEIEQIFNEIIEKIFGISIYPVEKNTEEKKTHSVEASIEENGLSIIERKIRENFNT